MFSILHSQHPCRLLQCGTIQTTLKEKPKQRLAVPPWKHIQKQKEIHGKLCTNREKINYFLFSILEFLKFLTKNSLCLVIASNSL